MPSLTKKLIHGKPYYYLRECQRVGGRPKIVWTLYLGSPQRLVERLTHPEPQSVALHEFGASAATYDIARELEVVSIIDRHVPKRGSRGPSVGQYLCVAALNRCIAPRSKAQLGDWYRKTILRRLLPFSSAQLTSQRFWDNMERVSEPQIVAIERELAAAAVARFGLDLRCLLFDATNFFTFVDSFNDRADLPQRGHSKEGRDNLRILGLALLVTSDGEVPLFHHTCAGNQHDAVTFRSASQELAERCRLLAQGACDITLVFDKGNNADDNLKAVGAGPFHFVGSLVPTQHPDLLAIGRKQMRRLDPQQLKAVWSYRTRKVVFAVERTVLVTFNEALFEAQRKTLRREVRKRRRKLQRLKVSLDRAPQRRGGKRPTVEGVGKKIQAILTGRHMKDLFAVAVEASANGSPRLSFRFRDESWKELASTLLGKTILFTDRDEWSDEQIVLAYRAQFHVEAAFRRMKDPRFLTFRPTFHWTDQKLRVHAFYCVLALMMVSLLSRKLAQAGIALSAAGMMAKLADIREVTLLYPAPPGAKAAFARTVLSELDDVQRKMLDALDLQRYRTN
ncbi:MAG: IS1634 family transposase [Deltaproteobacteria bacterium]|nr:IS1634 family transposase [Deltaproteobacteria bacterium]